MSDDGAAQGLTAQDALSVILGGEPEAEKEHHDKEELAARIRGTFEPTGYSSTADYAARLILEWLEADPTRAEFPVENIYERDGSGNLVFSSEGGLVLVEPGWDERMRQDGVPIDGLDLTGFMWGWAVNAARTIMEMPPVPNPAIITLDIP